MQYSILRFPGAKTRVLDRILPLLNDIEHEEFREVFVGGGSVYINKKKNQKNNVKYWINDKDKNIAALWEAIQRDPIGLKNMIRENYPTLELWKLWKSKSEDELSLLDKAFRLLFLNRTNYSGIISANPIGGVKNQEDASYKIDCRWNPDLLIKRIEVISEILQSTKITAEDYSEVIKKEGNQVLLFLDPPYYHKGESLYDEFMTSKQHESLANLLKDTNHKFLLTIDDCPEVRALYSWANIKNEQWKYTINSETNKVGKELFITNY